MELNACILGISDRLVVARHFRVAIVLTSSISGCMVCSFCKV